jgi:hypothetical protein
VRLPANLVRDWIDGGRRKRWGAKEHPTLRLAIYDTADTDTRRENALVFDREVHMRGCSQNALSLARLSNAPRAAPATALPSSVNR